MKRCTVCVGKKFNLGMGNMQEKCKTCDGKGFIPESEPLKVEKNKDKKFKLEDRYI